VTVVGWIFTVMGLIGLNRVVVGPLLFAEFGNYYSNLRSEHPVEYLLLYIGPVLQILSGAFVLLGHNWARWFLGMWIAFLTVASARNSNFKAAVFDSLWFVVAVYYLFRPCAKAFFKASFQSAPQIEKSAANPPVQRMAAGTIVGESDRPGAPPPLT
jgi:hypothetical protein